MKDKTPLWPSILTRYIAGRFLQSLLLCLFGLLSIFLLIEFFERVDNIMTMHLTLRILIEYLALRAPQILFQILPVALLMSVLLTLGGMAKDGELIALMAGGISLYHVIIPVLLICLVFTLLTGLYQESMGLTFSHSAEARLAQIKGEPPLQRLHQGRIWLAGRQGRFFHIQYLDHAEKSLKGVTIFEVDSSFILNSRWDIRRCYYQNGLWHLYDCTIWHFDGTDSRQESYSYKIIAWPEEFVDFARLQKDPAEMGYRELSEYIGRLNVWGYETSLLKTDLHFKLAFPWACFIFGLLGVPFAIHLHRAVRYISLGLGVGFAFLYWIIMHLSVSMAHAGILPPFAGAWAGNFIFGMLGIGLLYFVGVRP